MSPPDPVELLERLGSSQHEDAWERFLSIYSPLMLAVLGLFELDRDRIGDAYLHVCEILRRDDFRRLRGFRADGRASFATWLRAVVRHAYLDWRRKAHGRLRVFRSISRLTPVEQDVFRLVFEQGAGQDEALNALRNEYPTLTGDGLAEIVDRLHPLLTRRQRWLLSVRRARHVHLTSSPPEPGQVRELADGRLDPEQRAGRAELFARLDSALTQLPPRQRLLLRLRYEQELTLREVAELLGIGSPQAVARQLDAALETLRGRLGPQSLPTGEES